MLRSTPAAIDNEINILIGQMEILERREDAVFQLLENITRLRDSVSADKQALLEQKAELEAKKWPVNWIPNELLIQIFIMSCESGDLETDSDELYHRSPVILSHVCRRWREVCLMTSRLWSCIFHRSREFSRTALSTFVERSMTNPLHLIFESPRQDGPRVRRDADSAASYVLAELRPHVSRLQSIVFHSRRARAMEEMIDIINAPTCDLSCLRSLALSITEKEPSFVSTPSLLGINNLRRDAHRESAEASSFSRGNLRFLRLEQIPLHNVPPFLLPSVVSLELHFPPTKVTWAELRSQYALRMSHFRQFLALMPQLEELVLHDTVPFFDITSHAKINSHVGELGEIVDRPGHSIELPQLQRLEWGYPYPSDVHRFLAFLFAPSLEILDLCLDDLSLSRAGTYLFRGYGEVEQYRDDASVQRAVQLDALKELSLQYADDDSLTSVFRRLALPALEKVEIANVDSRRRKGDLPMALFPRLESIFRDPRLPNLSHFTLSHFKLDAEQGQSMLGYMPSLTDLSLDTCTGVNDLLEHLAETSVNNLETAPILAVKFCPRLDSLSLLGCDVEIGSLKRVVEARNLGERKDSSITENAKPTSRPMKKLRRVMGKASSSESGTQLHPAGPTNPNHLIGVGATTMFLRQAIRPANIVYIHIEDCGSLKSGEVYSLRNMGVEFVSWNGVEISQFS